MYNSKVSVDAFFSFYVDIDCTYFNVESSLLQLKMKALSSFEVEHQ